MLKNLLNALDGYKRIIVLIAYMAVAILKASGHGDYEGQLGTVLRILDWNADGTLPVPASVIAGTVAGAWAIVHAILKDIRDRRAASKTASLPKSG